MRLLIVWLINAAALFALPYLMSSINVDSFMAALIAALVLGLINTFIRPLLVLLTLPATLLSLGLFIFVINGLLFWFVGSVRPGFHVSGFWSGVGGAILYSIISWALSAILLRALPVDADKLPWRQAPNASYSFEFFPPATAEGAAEARGDARGTGGSRTEVLFGHLRRGRFDARPHPGHRARDPGSGTTCRAAHLVHRLVAREHALDARHLSRPRHSSSGRVARRLAFGQRRRGRISLRKRTRRVHPRRYRRLVSYRRRVLSGVSPAGDQPRCRSRQLQAQDRCRRRTRRSRSISSTPTATIASSTRRRPPASQSRSFPGVMPITSFSKLARFSDACGAEIPRWIRRKMESFGDDARFGARLRPRRRDRPVRGPAGAWRARAALLHAQSGQPDDHHLAAARALSRRQPDRRITSAGAKRHQLACRVLGADHALSGPPTVR